MGQEVVIVDPHGTEHVFPEGFDPQKAAGIVRESLNPPRSFSGLATNAANDIVPAIEGVGRGLKNTVMAGGTVMSALSGNLEAQKTAVDTGKNLVAGLVTKMKQAFSDPKGTAQGLFDAAYQHPIQAAMTVDPLIPGGGPITRGAGLLTSTAGRVMKAAAPEVMDMGLARTAADRREFPGAAQRLVDEGIVPFGDKGTRNVQAALTKTEQDVNAKAAAANPHLTAVRGSTPDQIATQAQGQAVTQGKVAGLGNVPGPEDAEIKKLKDLYLQQNTRPLSLPEKIEQKRAYQARGKYDTRNNAPTQTNNEVNFNRGIASANREDAIRIEPSLEGDLSKEKDLIGALTALENRSNKSMPLSTVGSARTLLGLRNPTVMGVPAIAIDRAGTALQSPLTPAMIRAALANLMVSHGSEQ